MALHKYNFIVSQCMGSPISDVDSLQKCSNMREEMEGFITNLQYRVCKELQAIEVDQQFVVDRWQRKNNGGGGISCVIQDGQIFEKAGVNISIVHGPLPLPAIQQMKARGTLSRVKGENLEFFACGISSVIHPRNPKVPTLHFNYRYFEVEDHAGESHWWFGGGTDLTPYFLNIDDCKHFHGTLKAACDDHGEKFYPRFKTWCDRYFFLKHRGICRGIGGIFFDDFDDLGLEESFEFIRSCGDSVIPSYIPLVKQHKDDPFTPSERDWQLVRRGHYVEFNLLYDRGTKFGLETPDARIESILMSLPLTARWEYNKTVTPGSAESQLMEVLTSPRDWV